MIEIKMPRLSDTMEEGAISTWHKQPGDTVAVGDVLVEIETDKAVMEYEAYEAGTLAEILVPEGQNADIGAPIALLDDGTGGPAATASAASAPTHSPERTQPTPVAPAASAPTQAPAAAVSSVANGTANGGDVTGGDVNEVARQIASPLVRKLARENHLDLSHVTGSGPGGRIIRADISGLLANGTPAQAQSQAESATIAEAVAAVPADAPPAPAVPVTAPAPAHPVPVSPET
ncbi:MAG: biotin/lipoyl-containing protein, partial [Trebonia sp.]